MAELGYFDVVNLPGGRTLRARSTLGELKDVNISDLSDGDMLLYREGSWINRPISDSDTDYILWCSTLAATATKTASSKTSFTPISGSYYLVFVKETNTASTPKMSCNNVPSPSTTIYINGSAASSTNKDLPAGLYLAKYDGTRWCFNTSGMSGDFSWNNADNYAFKTVSTITSIGDSAVTSASASIVADSNADTLTIAEGNKWIDIAGDATNDKVTIGHSGPDGGAMITKGSNVGNNSSTGLDFGSQFIVPYLSYDKAGHITGTGTKTLSLPARPTITGLSDTQTAVWSNSNKTLTFAKISQSTTGQITIGNGSNSLEFATAPSSSNKVVTQSDLSGIVGAMVYKGTVNSNSDLPTSGVQAGWTYVVATAGTYAGQACEVGDMIIAKDSTPTWNIVNGENQVTDGNPTLSWGTQSTVATVDGTDIHVTMPSNPNTDEKLSPDAITSGTTILPFIIGNATAPTNGHQNYRASVGVTGAGDIYQNVGNIYLGAITSNTTATKGIYFDRGTSTSRISWRLLSDSSQNFSLQSRLQSNSWSSAINVSTTGVTINTSTMTDGITATKFIKNGATTTNVLQAGGGDIALATIATSGSYADLSNKPILNTNNTTALTANASETITGTISLHKVAKTGTYSDLIGTPVFRTINGESLTAETSSDIDVHDGFYFPNAVQDYDGNWYGAVIIGDQVWLGENLRTSHLADGTVISVGSNSTSSLTYKDSDISVPIEKRGLIYSYAVVASASGAIIENWKCPTYADFKALQTYIESQARYPYAAKALAATDNWDTSTTENAIGNDLTLNNGTGFKAYPSATNNSSGQITNTNTCVLWSTTNSVSGSNKTCLVLGPNDVNFTTSDYSPSSWMMAIRLVSTLTPQQFRAWYVAQYGSMQHDLRDKRLWEDVDVVNGIGITYPNYPWYINQNGNWTIAYVAYRHCVIPVDDIRKVTIVTNSNVGTYISFFKSYTPPTGVSTGNNPVSEYATGYTGRVQISGANVTQDFVVPFDAKYLYVYTKASEDLTPAHVYLTGIGITEHRGNGTGYIMDDGSVLSNSNAQSDWNEYGSQEIPYIKAKPVFGNGLYSDYAIPALSDGKEYKQLDYVYVAPYSGTGPSLDTGISYSDDFELKITAYSQSSSATWYLIGSSGDSTGIQGQSSGDICLYLDGTNILSSTMSRTAGHIYTIVEKFKNGTASLYIKDETDGTEEFKTTAYTSTSFTSVTPILWRSGANRMASGNRVYRVEIWKGGTKVLDWIPMYNVTSDNYGFWDTVTESVKGYTQGYILGGNIVDRSISVELETPLDATIANGDKLVITDSSNSNRVSKSSISFDGSTTTSYLSQKGTWETVNSINTDSTIYCSSPASTTNKTGTSANWSEKIGWYNIILANGNSAYSATLSVNEGTAYPMYNNGQDTNIASSSTIDAGSHLAYFDGSTFRFSSVGMGATGYTMTSNTLESNRVKIFGSAMPQTTNIGIHPVYNGVLNTYTGENILVRLNGSDNITPKINGQTSSTSGNNTIAVGMHYPYYDGTTWWFRNDGKLTAGGYAIPNGTASQFLKADGSIDTTTYSTTDEKVTPTQLTYDNLHPVLLTFGANGDTSTPPTANGKPVFSYGLMAGQSGTIYLSSATAASTADTPSIVLRRGSWNDAYTDWKIFSPGVGSGSDNPLVIQRQTANVADQTKLSISNTKVLVGSTVTDGIEAPKFVKTGGASNEVLLANGDAAIDNSLDGQYFPNAVRDYDGNWYNAVVIGNQVWMTENMNTTHFTNGTEIAGSSGSVSTSVPFVTDTPYYFNYVSFGENGNYSYRENVGLLYNWCAVMNSSTTEGAQGIAPSGWHIPTEAEYQTLMTYVSSQSRYVDSTYDIGRALAAQDGWSGAQNTGLASNTYLNNATGWSGKPGGYKQGTSGNSYVSFNGYWWTSTEGSTTDTAQSFRIAYSASPYFTEHTNISKTYYRSVRCISDKSPLEFREWYFNTYDTLQHVVDTPNDIVLRNNGIGGATPSLMFKRGEDYPKSGAHYRDWFINGGSSGDLVFSYRTEPADKTSILTLADTGLSTTAITASSTVTTSGVLVTGHTTGNTVGFVRSDGQVDTNEYITNAALADLTGAMVYRGITTTVSGSTLGYSVSVNGSTITSGYTPKTGDVVVASQNVTIVPKTATSGTKTTLGGKQIDTNGDTSVEIGDQFIYNGTNWYVVSGEGQVTQDNTSFTTDESVKNLAKINGSQLSLGVIHHTPSGASAKTKGATADASGWGTTIKVPKVQSDAKGHIVGLDEYTLTIPSQPADEKVKQTVDATSTAYPLLMSAQSSPTSGTAYESKYSTSLKATGTGDMVFSKTVSSTTTICRLQYDNTLNCINFIFE